MKLENEIRIGNYLLDSRDNDIHKVSGNTIHSLQYDNSEILKPIPLTEEWLLRFGFEQIGSTVYTNIGSIEIGTISNGKRFYIQIRSENVTLPIKSVHELQNLFFCLCGKELVLQE